jgi:hypothetical protein
MRTVIAIICFLSCPSIAMAQSQSQSQSENPVSATDSLGRPLKADAKGKADTTSPTNTVGGGAPAASPQGETSPGHQAAPNGSSKAVKPKS